MNAKKATFVWVRMTVEEASIIKQSLQLFVNISPVEPEVTQLLGVLKECATCA